MVDDGPSPAGLPANAAVLGRRELVAAGARGIAPLRRHVGRPSDPVVIIWTSGTTGLPKGAWFDHDNLRAAVKSAGVMTAPFDRRLVTTPFAHAGYMAKLWEQLAWATTLVISPTPWSAADMVRLLGAEQITVAGGAPTQWAKVVEHPDLAQTDVSQLRLCVAATASAPPDLVERVTHAFGCPMVVRYAMTESPSITGTEPGDDPEVLFRTVGRPQAGVELELRDEAGAPVERGEVGRVHVRGACVMRGYWREPAVDGRSDRRTGMVADERPRAPRSRRQPGARRTGGRHVHPRRLQRVSPRGRERARGTSGSGTGERDRFPAPVIGEIGVAFVVPVGGTLHASSDDLRAWCRAQLADYKAPDRIVVVESLPLTSMMKIDKAALRARLEADAQ